MGRGRVQLKRIENKINRQVTFSKRRSGLMKKAQEISVLCDAEVAVIIFSSKGKLYEYSTDSSMEKILEKYEHHSYADRALHFKEADPQADWCLEYAKLKARVESLQKSQRHFMGEQLEILSIKELQHLEQQLESSLKQIRSRKIHIMLDSIADLQKKERTLQEQNKALEKEVKEKEKARQNTIWEQQQRSSTANPICRSYQPLFAEEEPPPAPLRLGSSVLPRWMLSHLTG